MAAVDFVALKAPFPATDIEWRVGRAGEKNGNVWAKCLAYITSRAIMDRLDEVCGPDNWATDFRHGPGHLQAGLGIRDPETGEWVWKWDGTGLLASSDGLSVTDAGKGDFSNALKRVAVQWGIGRYLYNLPEGWATVSDDGRFYGKLKSGKGFHWDPPALPGWALPDGSGKPSADETERVNRDTGEIEDEPASKPVEDDDMIACPACEGPMWDNREDPKSAVNGGKRPDLKCKDREGCDTAIWLGSWRDKLKSQLADAHSSQAIDAEERDRGEAAAESLSPKRMAALDKWLDERVSKAILGGAA